MKAFSFVLLALLPTACMEMGDEEDLLSEDESEILVAPVINFENSGEVMIRSALRPGTICSGTLVSNRSVLTAKQCVVNHGPFMLTANMFPLSPGRAIPISAIRMHPFLDVAIVDLFTPMAMNGAANGYRLGLDPAPTNTLAPTPSNPTPTVECRGFGEVVTGFAPDGLLRRAFLPVRNVNFNYWFTRFDLGINPSSGGQALSTGDIGGTCTRTTPGAGRVIVGVTSQIVNNWDARFAGLVGAESFAGWFTASVTPTP